MRILGLLFLFPASAFALYNGNPALPMMPESGFFISKDFCFGVKTGYEFDRVFYRELHLKGKGLRGLRKKGKDFTSLCNFGILTFNFIDRVEIFTTLGTMSAHFSQEPLEGKTVSYHTDSDFTWGVGGRALLAYWGELQATVNAAYVQSDLNLSSLKVNGHSYPTRKAEVDFIEWQIGAGISYRVDWFIPYFGVDFSDFRSRFEHLRSIAFIFPKKHVTFKESHPIGLFLGFGVAADKGFALNIEGRMINEYAVSASADIKY